MDYLVLFPAYTREKPRFAALAEAVLRQAADLMALAPGLMSGFSFARAEGIQLDALGDSERAMGYEEPWKDEADN